MTQINSEELKTEKHPASQIQVWQFVIVPTKQSSQGWFNFSCIRGTLLGNAVLWLIKLKVRKSVYWKRTVFIGQKTSILEVLIQLGIPLSSSETSTVCLRSSCTSFPFCVSPLIILTRTRLGKRGRAQWALLSRFVVEWLPILSIILSSTPFNHPARVFPKPLPIHSQEDFTSTASWRSSSSHFVAEDYQLWVVLVDWVFCHLCIYFYYLFPTNLPRQRIIPSHRRRKWGFSSRIYQNRMVLYKTQYGRPCQKWTRPDTGKTQESVSLTSHRRSLVKMSSLARSSWFHSSRSFSCPLQLSLSCSLVLKARKGQARINSPKTQKQGSQSHSPWPIIRAIYQMRC